MLGLGGGSLVKYCRKHLPTTHITAVEIDAEVIALRKHFHIPPDDSHLSVVNEDGARYVESMVQAGQRTDVMLVDAYDQRGIAKTVVGHPFLDNARRVLVPCGVFVMNLADDADQCDAYIETIRSAFGEPVIAVAMEHTDNVVVFAGGALRDRRRLVRAESPIRIASRGDSACISRRCCAVRANTKSGCVGKQSRARRGDDSFRFHHWAPDSGGKHKESAP